MAYVKYLLLLSLLVLGLTLLSGAAFAQDSWAVNGQDVPSGLTWDESASASVDVNNDGTTTWDTAYGLASTVGPTSAAQAEVDRWGVTRVPVVGTVDPAADYTFDFTVKAPPISTVAYPLPVGVSPGVIAGFYNNYVVFNGSGLIEPPVAVNTTKITRFNDIHTGDAPHVNYAFYIEELGGRVPVITTGYADGTFLPVNKVTRGAMAAFLQRSLELPLLDYQGLFSDVADTYGFALQIEACADAGVAKGFTPTTFAPTTNVKRHQMAVFLARGLCGGDEFVPSYLASDQTFTDVGVADFGFNAIEFCFDEGITTGYGDGTYGPLNTVTRGQMAAFLYRAFIQPTDSVVVLGGPAVTEVDTTTVDYDGWTSTSLAPPATPRTAYVGFDAVRLGDAQVVTVSFSVMDGTTELATSGDLTLDAATVKPAALSSGVPYAYVKWALPLDLPVGVDYTLQTTVDGVVLDREPAFSVGTLGTAMPLEGFEGGSLPAGWTVSLLNGATESFVVSTIASDACWQSDNCDYYGAPYGVPDGASAVMNWAGGSRPSWDNEPNEGEIITPAIDCSGFVAPQLHFSGAVAINTDNANGDCQYSVDGGATWTSVDPGNAADGGWWCACCDGGGWRSPDGYIDFTFDLPGAAGQSDVRVKWTFVGATAGDGTCCWGWIVDSVSVTGLQ